MSAIDLEDWVDRSWGERGVRRALLLLCLGLVLGVAVQAACLTPPLRSLEARLGDKRLRLWRQLAEADTRSAVLIAIDDDSMQSLHLRWPLPRGTYARIVDGLRKSGASAIGLAVLFEGAAPDAVDDALLSRALESGRDVVLANRLDPSGAARVIPASFKGRAGFTNVPVARDGVVREFYVWPPGFADPPRCMPLELLRVYFQDDQFVPRGFGGTPGTTYPVSFAGPVGETFQTIPVKKLLSGADLTHDVKGRIAIVGSTLRDGGGLLATPFSAGMASNMSGVELVANVMFTMMGGDALQPLSAVECWFLGVGLVFLTFQIFARVSLPSGVVLAGGLGVLFVIGSTYAMVNNHRVIPWVGPLLGLAASLGAATLFRAVGGGIALVRHWGRER